MDQFRLKTNAIGPITWCKPIISNQKYRKTEDNMFKHVKNSKLAFI